MKNPYEILGVPKTASQDEIKKAYRKLARRYHPDRNPGDKDAEERFKEIQGAYDVLGDPDKRKEYDRSAPACSPAAGAARASTRVRSDLATFDLGDLFGDLFGGGAPGRARDRRGRRGRDIEAVVNLSFEDSLAGVTVKVPVELNGVCTACRGSGAEAGTSPSSAPNAEAAASSPRARACSRSPSRARAAAATERSSRSRARCAAARAQVHQTKRYQVKIKPGVQDGTRIRLAGKGEPGINGGPPGDLSSRHVSRLRRLRAPRGQPRDRRADDLRGGGARRDGRGSDARRAQLSLKVPAGSQDGKMLRSGARAPRS